MPVTVKPSPQEALFSERGRAQHCQHQGSVNNLVKFNYKVYAALSF